MRATTGFFFLLVFLSSCNDSQGPGKVSPLLAELDRLAFVSQKGDPDLLVHRFEVTNAEFLRFVEETQYAGSGPAFLSHLQAEEGGLELPPSKRHHPVVFVSREDAAAFADWKKMRLPQKYEWELLACKVEIRSNFSGKLPQLFPWGRSWKPLLANTAELGFGASTPVGAFEGGRSPYGCYDVAGNVWEWVLFDPQNDALGEPINTIFAGFQEEGFGVLKGGSFHSRSERALCDVDLIVEPETRSHDAGFRCLIEFEPYLTERLRGFQPTDRDREMLREIVRRWGPETAPGFARLKDKPGMPVKLLDDLIRSVTGN